jgi:hypothetical protein
VQLRATEIQRVTRFKHVLLAPIDPEYELPGEHVDELLAGMVIGFLAPAAGLNLNPLRLKRPRSSDEVFDNVQTPAGNVARAILRMQQTPLVWSVTRAKAGNGGPVRVRELEEASHRDA